MVDAAHFRLIRDHGGLHGLRDENALESALARPRQLWNYSPKARLSDFTAAYGYGLTSNHPYLDGNKRIALVVMVAFLERNGRQLVVTNQEAISAMLGLAAGEMNEAKLAAWIDSSTS